MSKMIVTNHVKMVCFILPLVGSDCGFELITESYIISNNFCYHILKIQSWVTHSMLNISLLSMADTSVGLNVREQTIDIQSIEI